MFRTKFTAKLRLEQLFLCINLILVGSNIPLEDTATPLSSGFVVTVSKRTRGCIVTEDTGVLDVSVRSDDTFPRVEIEVALLGVVALENKIMKWDKLVS